MNIRAPASYVPAGDMGLGLCYLGTRRLAEIEIARAALEAEQAPPRTDGSMPAGFVPHFAVTMAPFPVYELPGRPVLALPVCFGCLAGTDQQCGGRPRDDRRPQLLVANGRVPR